MTQNLFTLDELVISQTKSFLNDQFMITDLDGTPVGTILQSTSLKDMVFKSSRSLEVALTDAEGNPLQTVMTISDPPNFQSITSVMINNMPSANRSYRRGLAREVGFSENGSSGHGCLG